LSIIQILASFFKVTASIRDSSDGKDGGVCASLESRNIGRIAAAADWVYAQFLAVHLTKE
jgi:hypothetical protein